MKKISVFILLILFISVNLFSQDFKQITDGIEYAEMTCGTEKEPIRLNLLRLDLSKVRLDVVHALDAAIGLEKTSSIATRHGAIAAINAGFFKMDGLYQGDAAGVLQIDGKLLSESYGNRIALLIKNNEKFTWVNFEHLKGSIEIMTPKGFLQITGINRQRVNNEIILFTSDFHQTTLTNPNGLEIIVVGNKVIQITEKGSSKIPHNGFVISASGEKKQDLIKQLKVGSIVKIGRTTSYYPHSEPLDFSNSKMLYAEDIVGGVPQLIKNGKIEITWEQEKIGKSFVETKHPRTAVAKLKDGKFLMVTVDGRQPEHSIGMNLNELAEFLLELGATDAMNLDGGGSTTMFLNGEIKNKPSDKTGERAVSDAILVFPRKK